MSYGYRQLGSGRTTGQVSSYRSEVNGTATAYVYTYDNAGNRLSKKKYAYTTGTPGNETATESYNYTGDRLTQVGSTVYQYDAIGNPTTYNGYTLE